MMATSALLSGDVWKEHLQSSAHGDCLIEAKELQLCVHRVCEICQKLFEILRETSCSLCEERIELRASIKGLAWNMPKAQMIPFGSNGKKVFNSLAGEDMLKYSFKSASADSLVARMHFFHYCTREDHLHMHVEFNRQYPHIAYDYLVARGIEQIKKIEFVNTLFGNRPHLHLTSEPETRALFHKLFDVLTEGNKFPSGEVKKLRKFVNNETCEETRPSWWRHLLCGDSYARLQHE